MLWEFEAREFLTVLRETLVKKCKAPNGATASFKSFRAGKATQLLKQNVQAPVIMERAEWKHPKTMARYADEDLIDPNKVLLAHMEKSDDEDEQVMKHWGFLGVGPAPREHHIALEMGRGSNVLPELKEAQTPETVTA